MFRERLAAKILLPIFTVLMVIAMLYFNMFAFLKLILNPTFINKVILSDKVVDLIYEEAVEKVIENGLKENKYNFPEDVDEDDIKELFDKDLVRFIMSETIEAAFTGDTDYDDDYIDEWIEDKEDILEDFDLSKSEIKDFKKSVNKVMEDTLEKVGEESSSSREDLYSSFDAQISGVLNSYIIVSAVFIIIMMVVLIIVFRNKFTPIRNFGISGTIASCISLAFVGLVALIIYASIQSSSDETMDFFVEIANNIVLYAVVILVVLLFVSIALIVVGQILAKKYIKNYNKVNDDEGTSYSTVPPVDAPYNQPMGYANETPRYEAPKYDSYTSDDDQ